MYTKASPVLITQNTKMLMLAKVHLSELPHLTHGQNQINICFVFNITAKTNTVIMLIITANVIEKSLTLCSHLAEPGQT